MSEVSFGNLRPIDAYGPGFFRVGGQVIRGAALVTGEGGVAWAGYDDPGALTALAGRIDVLLIGTGAEMAYLPQAFGAALETAELPAETMSSPAAARTYNVLLAEGRRVAAALLAVE